ncbi:hypothetical protein CARUB_v10003827mg [Capsella rubella]|uniref:Uncharacterized protein n=1 Tax=Capsella rubella TaxID=81985 RepID=R0FKU5_9BRAS|nr:hypothetical protein CARUB_v10003827mg [Capsella rubella]
MGHPLPPSSATPPSRRGWWSRPIVTPPAQPDCKSNCNECTLCLTPCCGGILTFIAVWICLGNFIFNAHCDAKFSIQSIAISPSSATWHVDFLVKSPSSRFLIFYGGDETAVRLGPLHAAVLNTSHARKSSSHTDFSVDFVAEGNSTDAVSEQLQIKLRANHNVYAFHPEPGHIDITCYIELFADSVSVSSSNWRVGLIATSPVSDCEISLRALKSSLIRGDQVISNSSSEFFGQFVTGNKIDVVFQNVVMPAVIGDVIWDFRVQVWSAVDTHVRFGNGFLMVSCPDIPVKFTTDTAGNVMGSLLGNIRRCDYIYQKKLA